MQIIDPTHAFYKPLWVRIAIVGVCAAWTLAESVKGDPFFLVIMGALTVYTARVLLITYKLPPESDPTAEAAVDTAESAKSAEEPPEKAG